MDLKKVWHQLFKQQIQCGKVYRDKRSVEKTTNVVKTKFKLAANHLEDIGVYPFYILTSRDCSISNFFRFEIEGTDWSWRKLKINSKPYLNSICSYLDIRKPEIFTLDDISDRTSRIWRFMHVGTLSVGKFNDLTGFCSRIQNTTDVDPAERDLMLIELTGSSDYVEDVDKFLDQWKI